MALDNQTVDITPTPRILRTLGEIPFQPWQCLAELIDNAVDAFAEAERMGHAIAEKKVTVSWSTDTVGSAARTLEILDSGLGMNLETLQNAARAGYSSNDPVHNLGLFGMGFNISTARLGEKTRLLSARPEDDKWLGIEIDFSELIKSKSFTAPVISEPKKNPSEHGTKIIVSGLKEGSYAQLRDQEVGIRRQLEVIYTPLLGQIDVEIFIQGKKLVPRQHCVWGKTRYVSRDGKNIPAVVEIDRDLGVALFDMERNTYLSRDDEIGVRDRAANNGGMLPANIIERHKRLKGWIGIQRYSDPNDFGIDFIRNGRKILIGSKVLFSYENPLTGTSVLEYPVELGSTVGGRIVGEVHVDFLLPTYQKNDFDRTDPSWTETIDALRDAGPILPTLRKAMGFTGANPSPVGLLANSYRRPDPGTRNLFVDKAIAKEFYEKFRRGDPDYINDDKWWGAAQEADRQRATGGASTSPQVDSGGTPSDNPDEYGPGAQSGTAQTTTATPLTTQQSTTVVQQPHTTELDELIQNSTEWVSWSGPYSYGHVPPLNVKVWELVSGKILIKGADLPCQFFADGIDCDFVFNPRHPFLSQFPVGPREMLCVYLAEKFKARDNQTDIGRLFSDMVQSKLQDVRVDRAGLQEKAAGMFDRLREKLIIGLSHKPIDVLNVVHESIGDTEETTNALLSNISLLMSFQEKMPDGIAALQFVPYRTILRIIDHFPEDLFDGKVFAAPYLKLNLSDQQATQRSRSESKERILTFLKDAFWVLSPSSGNLSGNRGKDELSRCSHSINFLTQELQD